MSSILRALKKAEQESPDPENLNRWPFKLNAGIALNSRTQSPRQRLGFKLRRLLFILGGLLIVASASSFLFFPVKLFQSGPSSFHAAPPQSPPLKPVKKEAIKTRPLTPLEGDHDSSKIAGQNNTADKKTPPPLFLNKFEKPRNRISNKKCLHRFLSLLKNPHPEKKKFSP